MKIPDLRMISPGLATALLVALLAPYLIESLQKKAPHETPTVVPTWPYAAIASTSTAADGIVASEIFELVKVPLVGPAYVSPSVKSD